MQMTNFVVQLKTSLVLSVAVHIIPAALVDDSHVMQVLWRPVIRCSG